MEMYCTEDVGNPASNSLETTIVAVWELVTIILFSSRLIICALWLNPANPTFGFCVQFVMLIY